MNSSDAPQRGFAIAWQFQVKPEQQREFERAYGSNGVWVKLFRTGDGYLKTELHRDPEKTGRYITLDFWRSREQYEKFKSESKPAYLEIDSKCEALTEGEQLLGEFSDVRSVRAAFPSLGKATLVGRRIIIGPATPADVPMILQIERAAESAAHWSQTVYAGIFHSKAQGRTVLVAEDANRHICGFVVARTVVAECELENIVTATNSTRRGIGSALLSALIQHARAVGCARIFLEVRESNHAARALYEKFGFQCDGERVGYYSNPLERAILYSLTL